MLEGYISGVVQSVGQLAPGCLYTDTPASVLSGYRDRLLTGSNPVTVAAIVHYASRKLVLSFRVL